MDWNGFVLGLEAGVVLALIAVYLYDLVQDVLRGRHTYVSPYISEPYLSPELYDWQAEEQDAVTVDRINTGVTTDQVELFNRNRRNVNKQMGFKP